MYGWTCEYTIVKCIFVWLIMQIYNCKVQTCMATHENIQFSVPQIEYPLWGISKKGSHVYFLLIVVMVLLLCCQIVLLWHQVNMVASEQHLYQTIVLPRKLVTGSIHDYLFCYCPLVGILFKVLRIIKCIQFELWIAYLYGHTWEYTNTKCILVWLDMRIYTCENILVSWDMRLYNLNCE